jgi:hypothetical protein
MGTNACGQYIKRVGLNAAASHLLTSETSIAEVGDHFSYFALLAKIREQGHSAPRLR